MGKWKGFYVPAGSDVEKYALELVHSVDTKHPLMCELGALFGYFDKNGVLLNRYLIHNSDHKKVMNYLKSRKNRSVYDDSLI